MRRLGLFLLIPVFGILFAGCSLSDWKAKAGLQVETKAANGHDNVAASVLLDGKYLDKTPYANAVMKPGDYALEIRPDDPSLVPYQTTISLKNGVLSFVLWQPGDHPETSGGVIYETEPLSDSHDAELSITTIPDGGIIRVDDVAKGFAPVLVEHISPGEHHYEVSLPSYVTQKNTINVLAGYRMNVTVKLARQAATTDTNAPTDTTSQLNATAAGQLSATATGQAASGAAGLAAGATASAQLTITPPASTNLARPKVQIRSTHYMQDGQEVLRVRDHADAGASTIGVAPVGSEYPYLHQTLDGWYKIQFQNQTGWVSQQYSSLLQ